MVCVGLRKFKENDGFSEKTAGKSRRCAEKKNAARRRRLKRGTKGCRRAPRERAPATFEELVRRAQVGRDLREHFFEAVADQGDGADDGDADERGDQAVFNRGGAVFVLQETLQHVILSVCRVLFTGPR